MIDQDIKRAIINAWAGGTYALDRSPYTDFSDIFSPKHAESHHLYLMADEMFYQENQELLSVLDKVYCIIRSNLPICLTSSDGYIRTFAELINNEKRIDNI